MDDLMGFEPVELSGPWPAHAPSGVLVLSEHEDGSLTIDHADPHVTFSVEVIESAARGDTSQVTITGLNYTAHGGHVGALLKIQAANRNVVYRLTEWLPTIRAYIGEWPE